MNDAANIVISSQRYLDPAIVAAKAAAQDYSAQYVTVDVDGITYAVVLDGHHSLAAAKQAGVDVEWEHLEDMQREADRMGAEDFLAAHHLGDDYYDVETGLGVW